MSEQEILLSNENLTNEQFKESNDVSSAEEDNIDGTLGFNKDQDQPETIEELREQVLKLKKQLMEAKYELRQKNKENADLRLKEKTDLNERIQSQNNVIEELKSKIGDIDILNQQISSLMEEKNRLLSENSQQKERIQELMENANLSNMYSANANNYSNIDQSKAAIIRNMIDISSELKNSYQEIIIAQQDE